MTAPGGTSRGDASPVPGAAGEPAHDAVVLPVQLRAVQRMLLVRELVESVPAAATLLMAGFAAIGAPGASAVRRSIAAAEIAASVWLLVLLRHGVRAALRRTDAAADDAPLELREPEDAVPPVEWAGVAGAVMLGVGQLQRWQDTGRVQRPVLLVAVVTLSLALGGRRGIARVMRRRIAARRPRLVLSADGVD